MQAGASGHQSFSVQRLGVGDDTLRRAVLSMFGRAFDDVPTYTAAQPSAAYLGRLLARDTFIAVAALQSDEVVGGLLPLAVGIHNLAQFGIAPIEFLGARGIGVYGGVAELALQLFVLGDEGADRFEHGAQLSACVAPTCGSDF